METDADAEARLLGHLRELGADELEIERARADGTLRSLAVQLMVAPDSRLTIGEVVERAGVELEDARRLWRAWGLPPPEPDDRRFGAEDVTILQFALLMEAAVGREVAFHTSRVMGTAVARIAEAEIGMIRSTIEVPMAEQGLPLADVVASYREIIDSMLGPARLSLEVLHLHCLVETARRHDALRVEASPVNLTETVVAFADLTGSTRLAVELALDELDHALSVFEERTADLIADGGASLVKRIGDAVMYIAPSAEVGVAVSLDLVEAFDRDTVVPPIRVGLAAGPVVALRGDYYGLTVNKAARLLNVARPSTVLAGEELCAGLRSGVDARSDGSHQLAGFPEPVPAFVLSRRRG